MAEDKLKPINVYVSEETHRKLKHVAVEMNCTVKELLESQTELLAEGLYKTVLEKLNK